MVLRVLRGFRNHKGLHTHQYLSLCAPRDPIAQATLPSLNVRSNVPLGALAHAGPPTLNAFSRLSLPTSALVLLWGVEAEWTIAPSDQGGGKWCRGLLCPILSNEASQGTQAIRAEKASELIPEDAGEWAQRGQGAHPPVPGISAGRVQET